MTSAPAFNLDGEIDRCVRYLLDKQAFEKTDGKSFYDDFGTANFSSKLESISAELSAAYQQLKALRGHFSNGNMVPFDHMGKRTNDATRQVIEALVTIHGMQYQLRLENPARSRELSLQKSAVWMAHCMKGIIGERQVRKVSKRIMDGARLGCPDDSTLTKWLQAFKKEEKPSEM